METYIRKDQVKFKILTLEFVKINFPDWCKNFSDEDLIKKIESYIHQTLNFNIIKKSNIQKFIGMAIKHRNIYSIELFQHERFSKLIRIKNEDFKLKALHRELVNYSKNR